MEDIYYTNLWNRVLNTIEESKQLSLDVLVNLKDTWIYSLTSEKAVIACRNVVALSILSEHRSFIETVLSNELGKQIYIEGISESVIKRDNNTKIFADLNIHNQLNPNYTFSNFITGKSNIQVHTGALACANNPGKFYNPLFIYGKPGVGKSHILNAIGNYINNNFKAQTVLLISSSDFVDLVFKFSKQGRLDELKEFFYRLDVFLMDDIQFIAGKEKTHEIFFNVFNELVSNQKQIVVTSDRSPEEIKGLEDRLVSRFNNGLKLMIEPPGYETSLSILKSKIDNYTELRGDIEEEVLEEIAKTFCNDVRSLEGALTRLIFYMINFSESQTITLKEYREAFKDQIPDTSNDLSVNKIIRSTCDYYGITPEQIKSKNRTANISNARHMAIYLCRKDLDIPFDSIGAEFGGRDHSTIISSCNKISKLIKQNPVYLKAVQDIEKKLGI